MWNDARRLESQGKEIDEALVGANKVLAIDRTKYGAKDQRVAVSLDYIAKLNLAKGDFAAAREARRGALAIWESVPGAAAWRVTDARLAVADIDVLEKLTKPQRADLAENDVAEETAEQTFRDGKFERGVTEARAVWQARKAIVGADDRRTLTSEMLLANCLAGQGKYADAVPLLEHVLKIRLQLLSAEHPDTATAYYNLGKAFQSQNQYAAAVTNYQAALAGRRKALGDQATDTRLSLASLADAQASLAAEHERAGRWEEARKARQESINLFTERYGEQDSRVTDGRLALADVERLAQLNPAEREQLGNADARHQAAANLYTDATNYDEAAARPGSMGDSPEDSGSRPSQIG